MIKFENPYYLVLLFVLIPLIMISIYSRIRYKKKLANFISKKMQKKLASSFSFKKSYAKKFFLFFGLVFLVIALANPQISTKLVEVNREGIDIVVAVDLSNSMLAEDIVPSRLQKTKREIKNFINNLTGDRIGLVGFTSLAFTQCPLTTDYSAALMFLDIMDTKLLPQNGTSLAAAISTSVKNFNEEEKKHKLLIIISDGEDHEEKVDEAVQDAIDKGIVIYTIGIGSFNGVPIPTNNGFLKDDEGNTVITKINELGLKKIASAGDGNYYLSSSSESELKAIFDDIAKIEKKEFTTDKVYGGYETIYQYFLIIGMLLVLIELVIPTRKKEEVV